MTKCFVLIDDKTTHDGQVISATSTMVVNGIKVDRALFRWLRRVWLEFLNSLRWNRARTLSDFIVQLTPMADMRQSSLLALMDNIHAGAQVQSLQSYLTRLTQVRLRLTPQTRGRGPSRCWRRTTS